MKLTKFKFLRVFSYIITLTAFYYIYVFLKDTKIDLYSTLFNLSNIPYLILISILYTCTLFIGGYFWTKIICFVTGRKISQHLLFVIYFRSNIGKYLPGNVGHYLGRNYYTNKIGISHLNAAFSSFVEVVLMIMLPTIFIVGLVISKLATLPSSISLNFHHNLTWAIIIAFILLSISYIGFILYVENSGKERVKEFYTKWITYLKQLISMKFMRLYFFGFIVMIIGFILNGLILYLISYWIFNFDLGINNMLNFTVATSIAGYAGIVVPGVPGGIGVKESMSVLLLSYYGYDKGLLAAIFIVSRICLIIAEVFLFLYSISVNWDLKNESINV